MIDGRDEDKTRKSTWTEEKSISFNNRARNREPIIALQRIVSNTPPGNALDLGAGAGVETGFLIQNGWNVTAIDKEIINKAEIETRLDDKQKTRLNFKEYSFEELIGKPELYKEQYDLVIGINSLFFCSKEKIDELLRQIGSSLKPGGILIANLLGKDDDWHGLPKHDDKKFFTIPEIEEILVESFFIMPKTFIERQFDEKSPSGKNKHWHCIWIRAIKK